MTRDDTVYVYCQVSKAEMLAWLACMTFAHQRTAGASVAGVARHQDTNVCLMLRHSAYSYIS